MIEKYEGEDGNEYEVCKCDKCGVILYDSGKKIWNGHVTIEGKYHYCLDCYEEVKQE